MDNVQNFNSYICFVDSTVIFFKEIVFVCVE
jgi:hypothetical protein